MTSGLVGRRFLVTRRPAQSGELIERLRAQGAEVVEVAAIEIAEPEDCGPLDTALRNLHRYHWVVFTSANAVNAVANRLGALGVDGTAIGRGTGVASVGAATSEAVRERFPGREISLQPATEFRADALLLAFRERGVRGERLLLPTSDRARETLAEGLVGAGGDVDLVVAYRTVPPRDLGTRLAGALAGGIDMALFASPSAVENFAEAAAGGGKGIPTGVIGPVTRQTAEAKGLEVRVVAERQTAEGLVAALVRYYAGLTEKS